MTSLLLQQQAILLEHLTGGAGIFADAANGPLASASPGPFGIDAGLLHLEARYSHDKRMAKIKWVLRRTFDLLGIEQEGIVRDFTEACPPTGIGRLENARQFHAFLEARWQSGPHAPVYLPDLASFELALVQVRGEDTAADAAPRCTGHAHPGMIRRNHRAILLRCSYDIRPMIEGDSGDSAVVRNDLRLALSMPPVASDPVILACSDGLFDLLERLDDFTDPELLESLLGSSEMIAELTAAGLLEVSA